MKKRGRRDPNKPLTVLIEPELHRRLAVEARVQSMTIQRHLHEILVDRFGVNDTATSMPKRRAMTC